MKIVLTIIDAKYSIKPFLEKDHFEQMFFGSELVLKSETLYGWGCKSSFTLDTLCSATKFALQDTKSV